VRTDEGTVDNVSVRSSAGWGISSEDGGHPVAEDYFCLYPRADGLRRYGKVGDLPRLAPTDDAIVIDAKLADNLGISEGDTVRLLDNDEKEYPVQVCGICENYVGHYVYMTTACYTRVFGEKPRDNLLLVKTVTGAAESANTPGAGQDLSSSAVAQRVSKMKGVITYSSIDETRDHFNESMKSLDVVVWIIIGAAAALAFLVLFNLTNINVTERVRELATLKVLGFYDGETASYVYRENIILTLMGAMLGMLGGKWLHRWLIGTIEMEYMIFGHGLHARSYLYAILLTVVFSMSVNFFSYFYIRKIDMVESLKSVE
jgi:putative ABC transport system permease protein